MRTTKTLTTLIAAAACAGALSLAYAQTGTTPPSVQDNTTGASSEMNNNRTGTSPGSTNTRSSSGSTNSNTGAAAGSANGSTANTGTAAGSSNGSSATSTSSHANPTDLTSERPARADRN